MNRLARRGMMMGALALGGGVFIVRLSHAQEILTADDAVAVALGYSADHTEVDSCIWTQ